MWPPSGRRSTPSTPSRRIPPAPSGEPEKTSGQRQQRGFDDDFAHHVPPARAQRLPDGQFLHPAVGADEQQVHQVDDADQQQRKTPACINSSVGRIAATWSAVQGRHDGTEAGVGHHLGLRIVRLQARRSARRSAPAPARAWRPD